MIWVVLWRIDVCIHLYFRAHFHYLVAVVVAPRIAVKALNRAADSKVGVVLDIKRGQFPLLRKHNKGLEPVKNALLVGAHNGDGVFFPVDYQAVAVGFNSPFFAYLGDIGENLFAVGGII